MRAGHLITAVAAFTAGAVLSPAANIADEFDAKDRAYWAFQIIRRPPLPKPRDGTWVKEPTDAFVLAELERKGIKPSASAAKATLLRRASLDMLGLPPSPQELHAFLDDTSTNAWDKVVDRLLASPHYGERWARHWLDLARYAESEGFKADETRPNAWRYRDYVIKSFNEDKSYDRFVQEQIAGDELFPEDTDARIATAFNRHYADESNARILMQRRQEILNDITDTVGAVFTGMTYACARCHDHKYDPILQTDYYRLQAFFANTAAKDDQPLLSSTELKRYNEKLAIWEEKTKDVRREIDELLAPDRRELEKDYFDKYPGAIQDILKKPASERNPYERQMAWKAAQYLDPRSHAYVGNTEAVIGKWRAEEKKKKSSGKTNAIERYETLRKKLGEFASLHPGPLPMTIGMGDLGEAAPPTFLLSRGSYEKPKEETPPGFLQILSPTPAKITPMNGSSGRRAALAKILTDTNNPLTARVIVNRIWHYHFGKGIVGTPSDFGSKGEPPTNPKLLDWLASEFMASGWSMKKMHRIILTSATYQQSSLWREDAGRLDPENKLLWRYPRHRLEGEPIRDSALAVAGLLNTKMGGPSSFPELPDGMPAPRGGWKVNSDPSERNRRSVYVFVRRNTRYPMFDAFDMPDPHESCSRRNVTTSPIQALTMLNSKLTLEWAQSFAARVLDSAGDNLDKQIAAAYELAFSRKPSTGETQTAKSFFARQRQIIAERKAADEELALPPILSASVDEVHAATLVDFCHSLFNANEFVYVN